MVVRVAKRVPAPVPARQTAADHEKGATASDGAHGAAGRLLEREEALLLLGRMAVVAAMMLVSRWMSDAAPAARARAPCAR